MTDDTRLDAQVRGALADLPMPDDNHTREALHTVLERSGGPRLARPAPRSWTAPILAAAAVAIVIVIVATLTGTVTRSPQTGPDPSAPRTSALVGSWSRQVTGATISGWDGRWQMLLGRDGVLTLSGPATVTDSSEGASYAATSRRLRVDAFVNSACNELAAGTYTWSLRDGMLTLTVIDDPCADRPDLFAGAWVPSV